MTGETDLDILLRSIKPVLNRGDYVFCNVKDLHALDLKNLVMLFAEAEGYTVILEKQLADAQALLYHDVVSWITLTVHSSLSAVGLTAAFSSALSAQQISCNVVAAYYHDHIFVPEKDAAPAMKILNDLMVE
jgi:hypothetical protein